MCRTLLEMSWSESHKNSLKSKNRGTYCRGPDIRCQISQLGCQELSRSQAPLSCRHCIRRHTHPALCQNFVRFHAGELGPEGFDLTFQSRMEEVPGHDCSIAANCCLPCHHRRCQSHEVSSQSLLTRTKSSLYWLQRVSLRTQKLENFHQESLGPAAASCSCPSTTVLNSFFQEL